MSRAVVPFLIAALSLGGCKRKEPSADELLARDNAKLAPKMAVLLRISKAPLPNATGKITLAGPPIRAIAGGNAVPEGNATLIFDADLQNDLTWFARVDLRTGGTMSLANDCVMLVQRHSLAGIHDKTYDRDPMWEEERAKAVLPACNLLRYVIVVKLFNYKPSEYKDYARWLPRHRINQSIKFILDGI